MADAEETAIIPSPPSSSSPGDNAAQRPRRKRWAPKVKTGCVTCRVRRVKCDETKPHCKRCTAYGYVCDGYVTPTNPTASHDGRVVRKSSAGSTGSVSGSPDYLDTVLEGRLTAPDNEFMECCQFYLEVLLPVRQRDLDYTNRGPLNLETRYRPGFLLSMTASQIALIAIATKTLPHPSQMTSINHLWSKFHAYMVHNIQDINTYLQGGSPYNRVLALLRITDVLSVELNLLGTSWRAHNSGFLALLNIKDSVGKMLPPSPGLDSARQFHIITAAVANSTSPAADQIEEIDGFTMEEIAGFFSKELNGEMPCPTTLFLEIIRITRLRRRLAEGFSFSAVIAPQLAEIMERLDAFVPETWEEPYGVPEQPEFLLMARVFKAAVTLYAVLTLPPPEHRSTPGAVEAWDQRRVALRDELLELMRESCMMLRSKAALSWPLAVAGVAVVDSKPEDQEFVASVFTSEDGGRGGSFYSPTYFVGKLRTFWESGTTRWEDCYSEPCPPMA